MSVPAKFLVPAVECPLVQLTFVSCVQLSHVDYDARSWEVASPPQKPVTYRYYPCELSSFHRTVVVFQQSIYDPIVRFHFGSFELWEASCERDSCNKHNCCAQIIENGYSQLDARERAASAAATRKKSLNEAREAWIQSKEEWGVEQAEKKLAKSAKKAQSARK